jgi:hypothetical protein
MKIARQIVVCMIALLLVAGSPLATPVTQQSGQTSSEQSAVAKPLPAPSIAAITTPKPSPTWETQSANRQLRNWYERICKQVWPPLWGAFFPPVWSNWALVIIAIWAACVTVGTFKNIESQTKAAITSADAANQSAKVAQRALQSERPLLWIIGKPEELNFMPRSKLPESYLRSHVACIAKKFWEWSGYRYEHHRGFDLQAPSKTAGLFRLFAKPSHDLCRT